MTNYNQEILAAMDLAVLESSDGVYFSCLNEIPKWFQVIYPEISAAKKPFNLARKFLFLANFLEDAAELWETGDKQRLKSGVWVETDAEGREHQIEAIAINLNNKKIIILESSSYSSKEKQLIFSKRNVFSFDQKMLQALERQETQIRADVKEKMDKEFQVLRAENAELREQLSELQKV